MKWCSSQKTILRILVYILITLAFIYITLLWFFPVISKDQNTIQKKPAITILKGMLDVISVLIPFWGLVAVYFLNSTYHIIEQLEKKREGAKVEERTLIESKIKRLENARPRAIRIMLLLIVFFSLSIICILYGMGLAEIDKLEKALFIWILGLFFVIFVLLFEYIYLLHTMTYWKREN